MTYGRTDMAMAVADLADLGPTISRGGVPMQQIVVTMLARAGQYIRHGIIMHGVERAASACGLHCAGGGKSPTAHSAAIGIASRASAPGS